MGFGGQPSEVLGFRRRSHEECTCISGDPHQKGERPYGCFAGRCFAQLPLKGVRGLSRSIALRLKKLRV